MQKNWDRYIDHVSAVAVKEATVEEAAVKEATVKEAAVEEAGRRRRSDCL